MKGTRPRAEAMEADLVELRRELARAAARNGRLVQALEELADAVVKYFYAPDGKVDEATFRVGKACGEAVKVLGEMRG